MCIKDFQIISAKIDELLPVKQKNLRHSDIQNLSIEQIYSNIKNKLVVLKELAQINQELKFENINFSNLTFTDIISENEEITAMTALTENQIIIGTIIGKLYIYDLNGDIEASKSSFDSKKQHKTEISNINVYKNYFISKCQQKLIVWKFKIVNEKLQVKTKKVLKYPQEIINVIWKDESHLYLCYKQSITLMNIKQTYPIKTFDLSVQINSCLLIKDSNDTFIISCEVPKCLLQLSSIKKKLNTNLYTSFRNGLMELNNNDIAVAFKDDNNNCSVTIIDKNIEKVIKKIKVSNLEDASLLRESNILYLVSKDNYQMIDIDNYESLKNLSQKNLSGKLGICFIKKHILLVYNYESTFLGVVKYKMPINN